MKYVLLAIIRYSFVRRIGGALMGALLALMAYNAYTFGAGAVRAHLLPAREAAKVEATSLREEKMQAIGMRARVILREMRAAESAVH